MDTHHFFIRTGLGRCALVGMLAGLSGVAMAQTPASAPALGTPAPAAQVAPAAARHAPQLTIRHIYDRVEAAGYRDQREIEWSDGRYEVKARDSQGERVKLQVDGHTGAIVRSRIQH